jgi:hypothetical protein
MMQLKRGVLLCFNLILVFVTQYIIQLIYSILYSCLLFASLSRQISATRQNHKLFFPHLLADCRFNATTYNSSLGQIVRNRNGTWPPELGGIETGAAAMVHYVHNFFLQIKKSPPLLYCNGFSDERQFAYDMLPFWMRCIPGAQSLLWRAGCKWAWPQFIDTPQHSLKATFTDIARNIPQVPIYLLHT